MLLLRIKRYKYKSVIVEKQSQLNSNSFLFNYKHYVNAILLHL